MTFNISLLEGNYINDNHLLIPSYEMNQKIFQFLFVYDLNISGAGSRRLCRCGSISCIHDSHIQRSV